MFLLSKLWQMQFLRNVFLFYYEGFKAMTVGKTLWIIIIIKLFIIFAILRVFSFRPTLTGTDEEKAEVVRERIVAPRPYLLQKGEE